MLEKNKAHKLDVETKQAWNENWQNVSIAEIMEIFDYPRGIRNRFINKNVEYWIEHEKSRGSIEDLSIDWSHTKAVMTIGDHYGFVFLNKSVRKPQDYNTLLSDIKRIFISLLHPQNKRPLFEAVMTFAEAYGESKRDEFSPDIILVPKEGFCVTRKIDRCGYFREVGFPGIHRKEGILIFNGEEIRRDKFHSAPNLIDIMPTILYLMKINIPQDLDGRVISEAFLKPISPPLSHSDSQIKRAKISYSKEEEKHIIKRLRGLGYLQ